MNRSEQFALLSTWKEWNVANHASMLTGELIGSVENPLRKDPNYNSRCDVKESSG